jgi:CMP-N-acetylneuraminic acid synthetase
MNFIVIPARANSKRVINKNIKKLNGKPLINHIFEKLNNKKIKEKIFVTSDSLKIKKLSALFKKIKFVKRPKKYATANSTTEEALIHLILKENLQNYEWVITIQPNSPFIKLKTLQNIINLTKKINTNCIMTVNKNTSDLWHKDKKSFFLNRLFPNSPRSSQRRVPLYEENSAIYATRVKYLLKTKKIFDKKMFFYEISKIEGFDINDETDFFIADSLKKNGY